MSDQLKLPKYRLHKGTGQALVQIAGRRIYLGVYGCPESHERYRRVITDWLAGERPIASADSIVSASSPIEISPSISELVLVYWEHVKRYYVKHGRPTGEDGNIRVALRFLLELYAHTSAATFGPQELKLVRQAMINVGLCRKSINARIRRVKALFRWGSEEGRIPSAVYHGLLAVKGLQRGRSAASERPPVSPAPEEDVQAALARLSSTVAAMVQIQDLTGMRPQDIRNLRTCDLDMSGDVWIYTPWTHKTEHHEHVRKIAIGPRAQALLRPFLRPTEPTRYVFAPRQAVAALHAQRRALRKTRPTPSELKRNRKPNPRRAPQDQYSKSSYEQAIARACSRAGVPRWSPNQLRHRCATRVRRLHGLDGAMAVLGHRLGTITEVYAEADLNRAIAIMRAIG